MQKLGDHEKGMKMETKTNGNADAKTRAIYMKFVSDLRCLKYTNRIYAGMIEGMRTETLAIGAKDFKGNGLSSK